MSSNRPGSACAVCGHYSCVCPIRSRHAPDCRFLVSATLPIGIPCEHGSDVCPICDPCSCGADVTASDLGSDVLLKRYDARKKSSSTVGRK